MQDLTKTTVALVNAAKLLLKKEDDLYTNKMYPKNKWNNYVIVVGRVSPYKLDPALDRGSGVKYATKRPHLFSLINIKCQRKIRDPFLQRGKAAFLWENPYWISQPNYTYRWFTVCVTYGFHNMSKYGEHMGQNCLLCRKDEGDYFSRNFVCILRTTNDSPHGKFHWFLFPFPSKFPDLNFTPFVLYIYPCHETRTWHTQWACVTCNIPILRVRVDSLQIDLFFKKRMLFGG